MPAPTKVRASKPWTIQRAIRTGRPGDSARAGDMVKWIDLQLRSAFHRPPGVERRPARRLPGSLGAAHSTCCRACNPNDLGRRPVPEDQLYEVAVFAHDDRVVLSGSKEDLRIFRVAKTD